MAKIRLANGIEITLDSRELLELIREYSSSDIKSLTAKEDTTTPKQSDFIQIAGETAEQRDSFMENFEIGSTQELTESIEANGRPFKFSVIEEQINRYGRHFGPKEYDKLYGRFYRAYEKVRKGMLEKYGGRWDTETVVIQGIQTTRYTLNENPLPIQKENEGSKSESLMRYEDQTSQNEVQNHPAPMDTV